MFNLYVSFIAMINIIATAKTLLVLSVVRGVVVDGVKMGNLYIKA